MSPAQNTVDESMLFVLHPRDICIEISDVTPHAVTEEVYTSSEGVDYLATILLKRWRDRLFFRTRYDSNMIFAITEPCPDSETDLIEFFHRHYKAKRYGRYFAHQHHPCEIVSPTEGVWALDWICGPWFHMDFSAQEYLLDIEGLLWQSDWEGFNQMARNSSRFKDFGEFAALLGASRQYEELPWRMQDIVFKREFNPEELYDFPETWITGSPEEARQLVQACVTVQPYTHHYITRTGRRKNGIVYLHSEGAFAPRWYGLNIGVTFFSQLIASYNYVVGWKWFNTDTSTPHLRSSWECKPIEIPLKIDHSSKSEAEIATAMEFLTNWLDENTDPDQRYLFSHELTMRVE